MLAQLVLSLAVAQTAHDPIPLSEIARPPSKGAKAAARPAPAGGGAQLRLVVVLVADQFRADYLTRFAENFGPNGFRRLLTEGAVFTGRYGQQNTYTGPGHALIASGAYAYVSGIMQNKWYNAKSKRSESMLFDPEAKLLIGETTPDDETSPRNFIGTTVGDELKMASPDSKVVAFGLKDRGAIMLGGRLGQTYFQSEANGEITTSTYYRSDVPQWAQAINAKRPWEAAFGKTWDRMLPADRYVGADDAKWEGDLKGMGKTFPHKMNGGLEKPGADSITVFQHSPFGVDFTFEVARAAIEGEQLGKRNAIDMLGVTVTPTDYVGHNFGPTSLEVQDVIYRLDKAVAEFLGYLDKRYKPGEYLVAFTADHGAVPAPEYSAERGLTAGRLKKKTLKEEINRVLGERFGKGEWVVALEDPSIYLDRGLIAQNKLDPQAVERAAGEAALNLPGILAFYTRTQLLNGWVPPTEQARAVVRSYVPSRSGDVVLVQAPYSFWGKYAEKDVGSTHGSPYRYDTDVPLIFMGAPFKPGLYGDTDMIDLAPTLSRVLGIAAPAACEGRALLQILR